jgi:hypothetical protein
VRPVHGEKAKARRKGGLEEENAKAGKKAGSTGKFIPFQCRTGHKATENGLLAYALNKRR